jgi:hypothetical protein
MDRLTSAHLLQKTQIRVQAVAALMVLWDRLLVRPDPEETEAFIAQWAPTRTAALVGVARLVDTYLTGWLQAYEVTPVAPPLDGEKVAAAVRGGTPDDEVLRRPVTQVRRHLADGWGFDRAMQAGRARAVKMAETDVQQAYRIGMRERMAAEPQIVGYERVLQGSSNCALCVVASTQRYRSNRLAPIHPGCDCGIAPLRPGTRLSGRSITDRLPRLDAAQRAVENGGIRSHDRAGMANLQVDADSLRAVEEADHGELGPLLTVAEHRTRTVTWKQRSRREFDEAGALTRS